MRRKHWFILFGIILLLSWIAAFALLISPLDLDTTHNFAYSSKPNSSGYASSMEMTSVQWEQFKNELYLNKISTNAISYLDSGDLKLVTFNGILVNKDFNFGYILPSTRKTNGSSAQNIEQVLFAISGVCTIIFVVVLLGAEYGN